MADSQRIAIVGGGSAGWMTALILARSFIQRGVEITVLESPTVPGKRRRGGRTEGLGQQELERLVVELEEEMFTAAEELRFEYAAKLRDEIKELRRELTAVSV